MSSLERLALVVAVCVTPLAALLQAQDPKKNTEPYQDLFQLDEDKYLGTWVGQVVHGDESFALVRAGARPKNTTYKKNAKHQSFPAATSWCQATVSNNLGGMGPDTSADPELRYQGIKGITTMEGAPLVDIVVTALSSYKPKTPEVNGFNAGTGNAGCFGIINLDDSDGPTSVDLEFKFMDSKTNAPVTVPFFEFLVYDIDMGANNTAIESLTVYNDIDRYVRSPTAKFDETGTLAETDSSSGVTFTATTVGTGDDNPTDPENLTPEQVDKTFIGLYKYTQKFRLTFSITGGGGGRNFMFSGKTPAPDAPEVKPECATGDCVIWGDPHVLTFDAHHEFADRHHNPRAFLRMRSNRRSEVVNVMDEGQFWLVKSDDVHIQGRYNKRPQQNTTVLGVLAVGGPFLRGNTFIVRPSVGKITWNGEVILSKLGSVFSNDLIEAKYHAAVENVKDGSKGHGLEVTLPGDLKLIVNRQTRGLAVKISMCAREWQDGQCGNFNGDSSDDVQTVLMERVLPFHQSEKLPRRKHLHRA